MKVAELNWLQVEEYLQHDDRAVIPLGSTEQHAFLSLCVDNILAEGVAIQAAEPLGIPVFPVLNYGMAPYFLAYPGTVSLRMDTYMHIVRDILDSLEKTGFKRILFVNGHGGNSAISSYVIEWMGDYPKVRVKFHNWWNAPKTWAKVQDISPNGSHASWMENFPWTRLAEVALPDEEKPMVDLARMRLLNPQDVRDYLGDGNMGGIYQKPDADMQDLWNIGVRETREALDGPWTT